MRSPHSEHTAPEIGRSSSRHSWHTGSREPLIRGEPHKRQSAGKTTLKRLSAAWAQNARKLPRPAEVVLGARIRSSLLLKTTLLQSCRAWRTAVECCSDSIASCPRDAQCKSDTPAWRMRHLRPPARRANLAQKINPGAQAKPTLPSPISPDSSADPHHIPAVPQCDKPATAGAQSPGSATVLRAPAAHTAHDPRLP
jgi:hypothetical protein